MLIHLSSFYNLSLQELDDLLDISLTDKVSDEVEYFLIDLERNYSVFLDNGQNIVDVVFKYLGVIFAKLENFFKNYNFDIVIIVLLKKIQVALNGNFYGAWSSSKLCYSICTFKQYRGTFRCAHHEYGVH